MVGQYIETASTPSTAFVPFVRRVGKGVLNGLAVAAGSAYASVRVSLDGHVLASNYLTGILSGPAHGNSGLAVGLAFDRELQVDIMSNVASPQTVFWASYRIETADDEESVEQSEAVEFVEFDGVEHAFRATGRSRVLIGATRSSYVALAEDTWFPGEPLRGGVRLISYDGTPLTADAIPVLVRAAGRTRVLGQVAMVETTSEGFAEFEIADPYMGELLYRRWRYDYPESRAPLPPGISPALELVANLPGYANHPSGAF